MAAVCVSVVKPVLLCFVDQRTDLRERERERERERGKRKG